MAAQSVTRSTKAAHAAGQTRPGDLVVGVDGTPGAALALRWAVREAHLRGRTLHAVLVWNATGEPTAVFRWNARADHAGLAASAAAVLRGAVREAAVPYGVRVVEHVVEGAPADSLALVAGNTALLVVGTNALLEAARGAQLLVVGAHGRGRDRPLCLGRLPSVGRLVGSRTCGCWSSRMSPTWPRPSATGCGWKRSRPTSPVTATPLWIC